MVIPCDATWKGYLINYIIFLWLLLLSSPEGGGTKESGGKQLEERGRDVAVLAESLEGMGDGRLGRVNVVEIVGRSFIDKVRYVDLDYFKWGKM